MIKKILICLLLIYVFFTDIIISQLQIPVLKTVLALLVILFFLLYYIINLKKLEYTRFVYISIFFIFISLVIWNTLGYLNLYYTIIFGWILAQDYKFTMKSLILISLIQFFLVVYESATTMIIYDSVTSGVLIQNEYNNSESYKLFDVTGFRPKGLFPGTLVATSFIIYLVMLFRNNIKMLLGLFILAIITNGRLALIIAGFTFFYKLFKKYDVVGVHGKMSGFNKFIKGYTFKSAKKRFMPKDTVEGEQLAREISPFILKKINKKKIPLMISLLKAILNNKKLKIN